MSLLIGYAQELEKVSHIFFNKVLFSLKISYNAGQNPPTHRFL
jgi:hypothetical protein